LRSISTSLAALLLPAAPAAAECRLTLAEVPSAVAFSYDPFDAQPSVAPLTLVLDSEGNAETLEFILSFVPGLAGPGQAPPLTARETDGLRPVSGSEGLHFLLDVGETRRIAPRFDISVPGQPVPRPGTYAGPIGVSVRDHATGEPCVERFDVPVALSVPSRAQITIAGTSGPIGPGPGLSRIDFGTLETGETVLVFLQLRANGDADVSLSSRENGVLRHTSLPDYAAPYVLAIDGRAIDLSARTSFRAPPAASIEGISLPMQITIGNVSGLPAGDYEDLVTISISAL
jgi:hypothetical protein